MRTIIIGLCIISGFGWGITSGFRSALIFNWITFMRPHDFDWSFWCNKPVFQMASLLLLVANLAHGRLRPRVTPFLAVYLLFFGWITMSCVFAFSPSISWAYYKMFFVPFPILFIILTGCLRSLAEMKWILMVMAGSIGLIACKTGVSMTLSGGGHITDQINGFVGDNNVLALSVCLALATLMGLRQILPAKRIYRILFYLMVSQVLMTILYTKSRGAFITVGTFLLMGAALGRNRIRNVAVLLLVVTAGYFALPEDLFSRLGSLQNVEEDSSSMGRVEMWKKAIQQANLRPIFGVGAGGFQLFNLLNWPEDFPDGHSLVTHSVYFQVLSTTGYGGLALYLTLLGITCWNLHSAYRLASRHKDKRPSLAWVVPAAFWMRNGFISYMVGSGFLDMLVYDTPWYFMLYASLLHANLRLALSAKTNPNDAKGLVRQARGRNARREGEGAIGESGFPDPAFPSK